MDTDIIINGGGLAGLALALSTARPGLHVTILEPLDFPTMREDRFDGRTTALAYTSMLMFGKLGLWEKLTSRAGAILDIRIVDGHSPLWLHFDHAEAEAGNDPHRPMGYIVENRYLRRALLDEVAANPHIDFRVGNAFDTYKISDQHVSVTLRSGGTLTGRLLVGADGKNSPTRSAAGIVSRHVDYGQAAIVCTVWHEQPHNGVAIERFLPAGPFAILPMGKVEEDAPGHHSSLVWTEKRNLAPHYMAMSETDFHAAVAARFGDHLGALKVVGGRWSYPINLTMAQDYAAERLALIGDAAHAIHPIAGQGYNLGMRDVAALAECILIAHSSGLDIGGATVLGNYARARKADSAMMILATDALNRLFSNNVTPIRIARRLGLAAVGKLPPLKKYFIRHAMGLRRDQSALMQDD